jgi:hypothetical protein
MCEPITVLLYELDSLALIVPASTSVVYRNQTGGHACVPCHVEGYVVPFAGEEHEEVALLDLQRTAG